MMPTQGVERILQRAIQLAHSGIRNPAIALVDAVELDSGDYPRDESRALSAVMDACGGSIVRWYEGKGRTPADCVKLLEETLFQVQMNGAP